MGKQDLIDRILSDAAAEAEEIVAEAERRAAQTEEAALSDAAAERERAQSEAGEKARRITEGRAAAARLEVSKIQLAERRRVIEEIYARAHKQLVSLGKNESVALIEKLLSSYADEGDEAQLSKNFAYADEVSALPVVKSKKITISKTRADISGGVILRGKACDKDLSFKALLEADMEENVADMAARLFAAAKR